MTAILALAMIASVHDGDTIRLVTGERIRIANIDAPERRGSPSCRAWKARTHWCNYALGDAGQRALAHYLTTGRIGIDRQGADRYGRTLATITVNGRDAGGYLVGLGLARWWR